MNTYSTSYGERLTTSQIDLKSDNSAKELLNEQLNEFGYNFCQECNRNDCKPIDVAHIVSRKQAKENGKSELCWDKENMKILGRECHKKIDKLILKFNDSAFQR